MTDVSEENVLGVTCDGFMLAWESTKLLWKIYFATANIIGS